jgi:Zn-dependent M28 family amino/carboxypeptidase
MRVFVYSCILFSFVAFSIWGYKAMIDVRPKGVRRPRLNAKAREVVNALEGYLKGHVGALAEEIGPRNVFFPAKLKAAADYIRTFWEDLGYAVTVQTFEVEATSCGNLSVEVLGGSKPEKIVVVGAHYDTIYHSPGANDNGSAVAALLELSRLAKDKGFNWTIRFVAFTNEEPPFFKTRHMGSLVYAKSCRKRKEDIVAMISLETLGYYREEPKTQKYPFPFRFFYPDTGDFLAVVGNLHSKSVVRSFAVSFLTASDFPIECAAPFGFITGIDWSDHWAFWQCGYQAIMLTDTALFRYPYYHSAEDTADKLDYPNLARVTYGVDKALELMINQPSETL